MDNVAQSMYVGNPFCSNCLSILFYKTAFKTGRRWVSYFPVVLNPFSQLKSQFQWLNSQALTSAYEKCHQWPRAIRAISAFQRFALRPNGVTLNAVLSSTEAWIMALQCFTWRWAVKGNGEISREKIISLIYIYIHIYIYPYTLYIIILCIYNIT